MEIEKVLFCEVKNMKILRKLFVLPHQFANESCFKIIKHLITYKYIIQEQENLKKRKSQNA